MIEINIEDYNYDLPTEKIAQYPLRERDESKLLLYKNKRISGDIFKNIDQYLPHGTLLVFNDSRVIRARLLFNKESGSKIEIFCLEPLSPGDYAASFSSKDSVEWKCLVGNVKKWKSGIIRTTFTRDKKRYSLNAEKLDQDGDTWRIRFSWDSAELSFGEVIEATGHIPLPPYLNRPDDETDSERYQTIYSRIKGSVAAPTAGLHFTKEVLNKLHHKDIQTAQVTLHVGAGTFQPVKSDIIMEHQMHQEHFWVPATAIECIIKNFSSVIAVGTTSVRTIESLYWIGLKLIRNPNTDPEDIWLGQWEPYSMTDTLDPVLVLESILLWMQRNGLTYLHAPTRIFILPGYHFKIISGMITNFHQPKSTLLLLISAWVGSDWKSIYKYAIENNFRFLSYGDSSLLFRQNN
jgi:S-adenosylmethionine:tRNA ribosyltransferase-isomerase